uniref:zinc finger CCCH domain-containing protein 10 isoform X2 n=1 Tax=Myxine glutinosa TaxID=7769 RepID=UPI00358DDAE3
MCSKVEAPLKMEKLEYRAVIKFLHLQGKMPQKIHDEMFAVYAGVTPSYDVVKHWCRQFKCGRLSIYDEPRSGRPASAHNEETVEKVEKMVLQDRRICIDKIVQTVGISHGSVCEMIRHQLNMKKVATQWVPRVLTPQQKTRRADHSVALLALCTAHPTDWFTRLVTLDEAWIHHFDPGTKASVQWKLQSSPILKKAKVQLSSGKVLLSVFWDSQGIIMTDYLRHGKTVTEQYYSDLLKKLRAQMECKRQGVLAKGVQLLHDGTPSHTSVDAVRCAKDCGFEPVPFPPHSPDLTPSDYFLFPMLKSHLRGKRFGSDEEVILAVESWFRSQKHDFYSNGIRKLTRRWEKCVAVDGNYIEKS